MVLNHCCSHRVHLIVDLGKFVKVTRDSTVEEGGCEPGLKVDKDDEEGHLL